VVLQVAMKGARSESTATPAGTAFTWTPAAPSFDREKLMQAQYDARLKALEIQSQNLSFAKPE